MKQHRICEICGNSMQFHVLSRVKLCLPSEVKLPSQYDVVACGVCGYCYADTLASMEDYDNYYTKHNYYSSTVVSDVSVNIPTTVMNNFCLEVCKHGDRILDVGFGYGNFLKFLKMKGYTNLFGIDPSWESVKHITQYEISAKVGSAYNLSSFDGDMMDVVVITGVLEHLLRPSLAIVSIQNVLKDNGVVILTVPNCNNLRYDNSPTCNNFNQEHINYFSPKTLLGLMGKYGFFMEKIITEPYYADMLVAFRYKKNQHVLKFEKDVQTAQAIRIYIEKNKSRIDEINTKLEKLVREQSRIAIWGTGALTMDLLANTNLSQCNIGCFVDNNQLKWGKDFYQKKIISPTVLWENDEIQTVIISSIKSAKAIEKQLMDSGWRKEILIL